MLWQFLLLILSLGILFAGAESLVRGSSSLALRFGITPLVVGLTVVAFGTSAPELVVGVSAALAGQGDLAVGNVIGSNSFNIGVILGITALICPIKVALPVLKLDAPIMIATAGVVAVLALGGDIGRPIGAGLVVVLVGYTVFNIVMARRENTPELTEEFTAGIPPPSPSPWRDGLLALAGLGLLVIGSRLLVDSSVEIARVFGLSEAVIGLTIVSAGTSMPELATSLVAAIRRQPDIAIGNVIGSNIFNSLGILGGASLAGPLTAPGILPLDVWTMVILSVCLLPLMWSARSIQRWEGTLLLAGYATYLWLRWPAA